MKVAEKQKSPQLLDTKSDYNNYSNLSYFISQYKRAVEIINECETFYSNFLRSKLLSVEQIKNTPGINFLNMEFSFGEYKKNAKDLYEYFVYKHLSKEFEEKLTGYRYVYQRKEIYDRIGCVVGYDVGDYRVEPTVNGIHEKNPSWSTSYFSWIMGCLKEDNPWKFSYSEQQYTWPSNKFLDKIIAVDDDGKVYIEGFEKIGKNKGKITNNKKSFVVETVDIERKSSSYNSAKSKYKPTGMFDTFVVLRKEENDLIDIVSKFYKKYKCIEKDIYFNPYKYIDLWKEFVEFRHASLNPKDKGFKAKTPGEYVIHHESLDSKKYHADMFAPVNYMIFPTGYKTENNEEVWVNGEYSIDAIQFVRGDLLEKGTQLYYKELCTTDKFINKTKLKRHIEKIHPEAADAVKYNVDYLFDESYYYVLIDNTPYKFTNCLSDVKIKYDEKNNILECDFENEYRRKKAQWPGWLPWIVTTNYYHLTFDCSTNEPIEYSHRYDQVEESCK